MSNSRYARGLTARAFEMVLTARPTDRTRQWRYPLYSLRNTEIPRVRDVAHRDGDGSHIGRFVKRISALSLRRLLPFPRMNPRSLVSWTTGS